MGNPNSQDVITKITEGLKNAKISKTCSHCRIHSVQDWSYISVEGRLVFYNKETNAIAMAKCQNCSNYSYWVEGMQIYPRVSAAPSPNQHMPKEILSIFNEARLIYQDSTRSAAALLRLSIQMLLKHLGETGENINSDIGNLVKKGLPPRIQKALDIVRVTGNEAVHPGVIDTDNKKIVLELFNLVNLIIEKTIEEEAKINEIFESLPEGKKEGIKNRDAK